ncbi:MAG TPA: hypothetical protein VJ036_03030 [bacterium]|jgi:hypothetical protein|nr:hypothetical protein [bacterium]
MRRLFVIILMSAILISGYLYTRHSWGSVEAFNRCNLFPYEPVAGFQMEAKT